MKLIAILLSVLMLTIAFDACPDIDSCDDKDQTELAAKSDQSADEDACSPFCHCLRCPFSILLPQFSSDVFVRSFSERNFASNAEPFLLNVIKSVWQPPKTA